MTMPRASIVSLEETQWYHCVSRCVRRAFLCGKDESTGKDFSHRRVWIAERIKVLSEVFCIDVAGYAVMSNHYHVVVYIDREKALSLSKKEVLERWCRIFRGDEIVRKYLNNEEMSPGEEAALEKEVEDIRERLYSLSWYMRCLNEYVARLANKEDGVKGRFWEGRYKSQALLDEKALLAALAYVDLNPVRAGIAKLPEESEFTSIHDRLEAKKKGEDPPKRLMPFSGEGGEASGASYGIPYGFDDYLELVDWTAKHIRKDGRGYVDEKVPSILVRLGLEPEGFLEFAGSFLKEFGHAVGNPNRLRLRCARHGMRYVKGIRAAKRALG